MSQQIHRDPFSSVEFFEFESDIAKHSYLFLKFNLVYKVTQLLFYTTTRHAWERNERGALLGMNVAISCKAVRGYLSTSEMKARLCVVKWQNDLFVYNETGGWLCVAKWEDYHV